MRPDVPGFRNLYPFHLVGPLGFLVFAIASVGPEWMWWVSVPVVVLAVLRVALVRAELGPDWLLVVNFWRSHRVAATDVARFGTGRVLLPSSTTVWGGAARLHLRDGRTIDVAASHGYGYGARELHLTGGTLERFEALRGWAAGHGIPFELEALDLVEPPSPRRRTTWPFGG